MRSLFHAPHGLLRFARNDGGKRAGIHRPRHPLLSAVIAGSAAQPVQSDAADGVEGRQSRPKQRSTDEEGFTLVELMVVIVIIGLLATIVAVNVLPNLGKANTGKARSDVGMLAQGLEFYRLDNMSYPRTEQGLKALVAAPAGLAQPGRYRAGGYIKKLPDDPWGKPYEYAAPGTHGGPFDISSLGADGQPGGEGEDADIGSWQ